MQGGVYAEQIRGVELPRDSYRAQYFNQNRRKPDFQSLKIFARAPGRLPVMALKFQIE
jgi:hypothetical protein